MKDPTGHYVADPSTTAAYDPPDDYSDECPSCGNEDPDREESECPQCGSMKCSMCDMGDDVECPSCT